MISNQHYIELYVNDQLIELESQESLNLRINNVIFNPTKTTTTQAEYSYSFEIPSTNVNDTILDYANNLAKLNKFHARYKAMVYADGNLIFDGSLTIQKYSSKTKKYTCNLVNIKVNTLDEIFGEDKLTDMHWDVPFSGAPTINSVNADMNSKYCFPLVSYGVFQKNYVRADSVGADYTPKSSIDKYNKWWVESFYPSLNVVEEMRKCFENKGYRVGGSVFSDPFIKDIFASCNLAQEQVPIYNLGNPKFGKLSLNVTWNNYSSQGEYGGSVFSRGRSEYSHENTTGGLQQELKFPYENCGPGNRPQGTTEAQYNFDTIMFWNMLDSTSNSAVTVTMQHDNYLLDPNEHLIVIPADGWYKIDLTVNATLKDSGTNFTAPMWYTNYYEGFEFAKYNKTLPCTFSAYKGGYFTPLEIQLIRNYDENIELIKGKKNVKYFTGDPNEDVYHYEGGSYTSATYANKVEWETEFPHQALYGSNSPTKSNELVNSAVENQSAFGRANNNTGGASVNGGSNYGGRRAGTFGNGDYMNGGDTGRTTNGQAGGTSYNTYGFMHKDGKVMPYDQVVSTAFICGFSTMSDGTVSVMRNGRSWSNLSTINNHMMANVDGLNLYNKDASGNTVVEETNYCSNTYKGSPNCSINVYQNSMNGTIHCCVYLNKNDILELCAIQRDYEGQKYSTSANCSMTIEAMSTRSEELLRSDSGWNYYSATEFPVNLNLFNFTNDETKVSDWISSVQKAFNLDIVQQGNNIEINTNQGVKKDVIYAINIDDRVSENEVESEFISYPKQLAVKYKTDIEEYGFELSVPQEYINDDDWFEHGDSGFTVIQLNDDSYETSKQETSTNFSYTWYMDFEFKQITDYFNKTEGNPKTIRIPVIEKSEYMAEGYGYDDAMKHDGYSFAQRFWYRKIPSTDYVWLDSVLSNGTHETVYLMYPKNYINDFNLSYKDNEKSIVTEYFNIHPMLSSNYVKVEAYLTPQEYQDLKNGALIKYDSDLYYISEISGYDASGNNLTTLKMIKKI